jgi:hypothetical protein
MVVEARVGVKMVREGGLYKRVTMRVLFCDVK